MKILGLISIVALLIIVGGLVLFFDEYKEIRNDSSQEKVLRVNTLGYQDYSQRNLDTAKLKGKPVLFFAATKWCQTCARLEKDILERTGEIPEDVTILKVDYDNDLAMNRAWGVTAQHTLVALDDDGEEVTRWVGIGMDSLLKEINNI